MSYTLVFDIGKTNKKCFLFDSEYRESGSSYVQFDEKKDEDGFPCDDLDAIEGWVKDTLELELKNNAGNIEAINFSTYGASFVHLDERGRPLTPLYNYLKSYPKKLLHQFYKKYGDPDRIARETASPQLGMLNSGMQLYWLKHSRPEVFKKIHWSLHFPQYMSYLITGNPVSDFTSIGCHTGLWDFERKDYHHWVYEEGIDRKLPPIVESHTYGEIMLQGRPVKVGVGIHDSSGALIPYLKSDSEPFLLISTGTWSIALNPFNDEPLSGEALKNDCLMYMQADGTPVMAARLFLGNEYSIQVKKLADHYGVNRDKHKSVAFKEDIYLDLNTDYQRHFRFESISLPRIQPTRNIYDGLATFEEAIHQLVLELSEMQASAVGRVRGKRQVKKIYIDGGFVDNELYVMILSRLLPGLEIWTTRSPMGSALGAAIVISRKGTGKKFMEKYLAMSKIQQ